MTKQECGHDINFCHYCAGDNNVCLCNPETTVISTEVMEQLEDQAGQLAYFSESEAQILARLVNIYQTGFNHGSK